MNLLRRAGLALAGLLVSLPGVIAVATPPAHADGLRTGMTWSVTGQANGYVHVGADGTSNPYTGDTEVSRFLSALCLRNDGSAPPSGVDFDFYNGWAQGTVRATAPIRGDVLADSQGAADAVCADTFGYGWRLAEFHDGRYGSDFSQGGGWSFWAAAGGSFLPGARFWAAIADQPANPWNSAGTLPAPLPAQGQNDMILRAKLDDIVSPLLRTSSGTAFQNLVRNIAARQVDGDSNAYMSTVVAEAEATGAVNPYAPDWVAFKNSVADFTVNGHAYTPQILIPNYEDGVLLGDPVTVAVAGVEGGQDALDAYTISGGQVVATAPVTEAYAETNEVWVLSINDELGNGTLAAAAANKAGAQEAGKAAGTKTVEAVIGARAGTTVVCNPTGLRTNNGMEYTSWFRVGNPSSLESWFSGKLEMRMIVVGRGGTEIKNAYFGKIKRKSVKNGVTVDLYLTTWDRAQLGDYWAFKWVEEDHGPTIKLSLGLGDWIKQLLGVPISFNIEATFAAGNDDAGSGVVAFTESTYITYSTGTVEWRQCSVGGDGGTGNDNFARQAVVAASSTYPGYSAARVNDGDRNTSLGGAYSWANNSGGVNYPPQWVQLDFGVAKTFQRIVVYTSAGYPIRDFDIQVWNGITWTTPAGGQVRGNTALQVTVLFTVPQSARLVRVYGLSGPTHQQGYVRVNEFEVYAS